MRLMIHAPVIRTVRDISCVEPKMIDPGMSTMAWVPAPIPIANARVIQAPCEAKVR